MGVSVVDGGFESTAVGEPKLMQCIVISLSATIRLGNYKRPVPAPLAPGDVRRYLKRKYAVMKAEDLKKEEEDDQKAAFDMDAKKGAYQRGVKGVFHSIKFHTWNPKWMEYGDNGYKLFCAAAGVKMTGDQKHVDGVREMWNEIKKQVCRDLTLFNGNFRTKVKKRMESKYLIHGGVFLSPFFSYQCLMFC